MAESIALDFGPPFDAEEEEAIRTVSQLIQHGWFSDELNEDGKIVVNKGTSKCAS